MAPEFWLTLGITLVGWAVTMIVFIRKQERDKMNVEADFDKRISLLEKKHEQDMEKVESSIALQERDFRQHELNNEKQFERYHLDMRQDIDKVFKEVNSVKDLIMGLVLNGKIKTSE